jgi:hypothetical protein
MPQRAMPPSRASGKPGSPRYHPRIPNDRHRHSRALPALNVLRLLPVAIALLLLAAHFYRGALWIAFGVTVALLPLLLVRAPWAARVLQAALLLGCVEWLRTAAALIAIRQSFGQPWTRLALILGAVALATALCALVFRSRAVRERFGLPAAPHPDA